MKVTYDPAVDVLRIILSNATVAESDEDKPGIILDYDKDGNVVGMEILDASRRVENPQGMEYTIVSDPTLAVREKPARKYGNHK